MADIMDQNNNKSPIKKIDLNRKKRKPLMEKRRRARINASLEQLKKLVLDATRKDSARYSKLEKADILELTVRHLRDIQRNHFNYALQHDPNIVAKFGDGFGECVTEVGRYLSTTDGAGVPKDVHSRLLTHLSNMSQKVPTMNASPLGSFPSPTAGSALLPGAALPSPPHVRVPPPHSPFVVNRQGLPVFQNLPTLTVSTPQQHVQMANHMAMMSLPLSPIRHSNTDASMSLLNTPYNQQSRNQQNCATKTVPLLHDDTHERMFHSKFSTAASNKSSGKYIDNNRDLQHPEISMMTASKNQCYEEANHFTRYNKLHTVKIEVTEEESHCVRENKEAFKPMECYQTIDVQQDDDNVWRPW